MKQKRKSTGERNMYPLKEVTFLTWDDMILFKVTFSITK